MGASSTRQTATINIPQRTCLHPATNMIPTPDLSHLKTEDYRHVYEPAGVFSVLISKTVLSLPSGKRIRLSC